MKIKGIPVDEWFDHEDVKRYYPAREDIHCFVYKERKLFVVYVEGGKRHPILHNDSFETAVYFVEQVKKDFIEREKECTSQ